MATTRLPVAGYFAAGRLNPGVRQALSQLSRTSSSDVAGELLSAFYHRSNLKGRGTGLVLFVHGKHEALGALVYTDVRLNGSNPTISATPTAYQKGDQEILLTVRSLLAAQQEAENYREIFPYPFIDKRLWTPRAVAERPKRICRFLRLSRRIGKLFLCGWTTRSWDQPTGPDELIAHFMDGDVISSETVAGFYPRDDLAGRGIGYVIFAAVWNAPSGLLSPLSCA